MSQRQTRAHPKPQATAATLLAVALAFVVNLVVVSITLIEDFGREESLKTLLNSLQSKAFIGEGDVVPKILEEWIMPVEDYSALAKYNSLAQGVIDEREKFGGPVKWWKLHCQT